MIIPGELGDIVWVRCKIESASIGSDGIQYNVVVDDGSCTHLYHVSDAATEVPLQEIPFELDPSLPNDDELSKPAAPKKRGRPRKSNSGRSDYKN